MKLNARQLKATNEKNPEHQKARKTDGCICCGCRCLYRHARIHYALRIIIALFIIIRREVDREDNSSIFQRVGMVKRVSDSGLFSGGVGDVFLHPRPLNEGRRVN